MEDRARSRKAPMENWQANAVETLARSMQQTDLEDITPTRKPIEDWQSNAAETIARSMERTNDPAYAVQRAWPSVRKSTLRAVTPENRHMEGNVAESPTSMAQSSPRSIPGGEKSQERRKGLVFQDSYSTDSLDAKPHHLHGPPVAFHTSARPRTRTLDESNRQRSSSNNGPQPSRQRVGSLHTTSGFTFHDVEPRSLPDENQPTSLNHPPLSTRSQSSASKSGSVKAKKLSKRSSRPLSPLQAVSDVPTVDCLSSPVATGNANKILMLMRTLCGKMKGDVEIQSVESGVWYSGSCYIDEDKGSLVHEGDERTTCQIPVISDLRGCKVRPIIEAERQTKCLEITNKAEGVAVLLLPYVKADFDLWLAALLCWQQIQPQLAASSPASPIDRRPPSQRRNSVFLPRSMNGGRESNIIKVAKLQLWDRGPSLSPRTTVKSRSTRDLKATMMPRWRKVSCLLQDNGEFKLLTENDVTLLSVIQLSQLSRSAIHRLDRSVLDEEHCIVILPQYTSTSTQLSIFRPVYISLEDRVSFEVWFCLLRAFTIPEIYGPSIAEDEENGLPSTAPDYEDIFRIEKTLTVRVVEAKLKKSIVSSGSKHGKLKSEKDLSVGDYYAEVLLDGELGARTNVKSDTRNPFWREDCEFSDLPAYMPRVTVVLKRVNRPEAYGNGFLTPSTASVHATPIDVNYGFVEVPVEKLERGKDNETWWPILNDQDEQIGELFLKIRNDEIVVLLAKEYQEISELLHKFSNGLTLQIAQSAPSHLKPLSEILMNIFQVSGHATDWLKALVEDEIDGLGKDMPSKRIRWSKRIGSNESFNSNGDREANVRDISKSLQGEANLLFRGNSLLTQALDAHMRRLGKEYLDEVLGDRIEEINTLNSDCEVDPSRIGPGEDLQKNWTVLLSLTTKIWKGISASVARCPTELRHILKYVRAVAEDRYGDFLRPVAYTSVSGFLFLRFFCPALLNPKLFGLLRDHPRPKAQRALTLVAKSLQALANLSTFGAKEAWMEPMNKFLSSNRQDVKDYIDQICAIPADRTTTFALPAPYSTPITILGRLPPTSREGFPSLPFLIDHARNFATLVKLWLEATSRYVAPPDTDGDLLTFNDLCVALQKRTDECLLRAEQADRVAEQSSSHYEDIVEPALLVPRPEVEDVQISQWAEYSMNDSKQPAVAVTRPQRDAPGSAGSEGMSTTSGNSGTTQKDKKDRQSFWESKFGKDSKYQRPYEPLDVAQISPPARVPSRNNGKQSRGFLMGLRRRGTKDGEKEKDKEKSRHKDARGNGTGLAEHSGNTDRPGMGRKGSWIGNGGMI